MNWQGRELAATGRQSRWREIGRIRLVALTALLLGHIAFSIFAVAPGHLVSDEGIYHQMSKAFADDLTLTLWQEYSEFPSPELRTWNHVQGKDGGLQSQYPYLHPVLAWPFYKLAGFRGLFALNAVAYIALAGFCLLLGARLWGDKRIAADAVILMTLGSYAWQYSQAAWSQSLSSVFLMAAIYFGVCTVQEKTNRTALLFGGAAGLAVGLGAGVRLDVFFMAPALFIPLLYDRVPRWRVAAAVLAGLLPGLLLLSLTNYAKFGTLQPLSYGRTGGGASLSSYTPLLAMAAATLIAAWIASRDTIWPRVVRHRLVLGSVSAVAFAAVLFLLPSVGARMWSLIRGIWILIADLSLIDPAVGGIAITRGPTGAIMYAEIAKKALLQSMPWLPVALLAIAAIPRNREAVWIHSIPVLTIMAFLTVYGWFTWHGGYAFNLRYFVPLLPILAIYGAKGIHTLLHDDTSAKLRIAAAATSFVAGLAWLFVLFKDSDKDAVTEVILNLPLQLAAVLAALLVLFLIRPASKAIRRAALMASFACMAWAFIMALILDFPVTWVIRNHHHETGQFLARNVPENSVLFSMYSPGAFALTEIPNARNAWVSMDQYRDSRKILEINLKAGNEILAFFNDEDWEEFKSRGMLDGMNASEIADISEITLYRLEPVAIRAPGNAQ